MLELHPPRAQPCLHGRPPEGHVRRHGAARQGPRGLREGGVCGSAPAAQDQGRGGARAHGPGGRVPVRAGEQRVARRRGGRGAQARTACVRLLATPRLRDPRRLLRARAHRARPRAVLPQGLLGLLRAAVQGNNAAQAFGRRDARRRHGRDAGDATEGSGKSRCGAVRRPRGGARPSGDRRARGGTGDGVLHGRLRDVGHSRVHGAVRARAPPGGAGTRARGGACGGAAPRRPHVRRPGRRALPAHGRHGGAAAVPVAAVPRPHVRARLRSAGWRGGGSGHARLHPRDGHAARRAPFPRRPRLPTRALGAGRAPAPAVLLLLRRRPPHLHRDALRAARREAVRGAASVALRGSAVRRHAIRPHRQPLWPVSQVLRGRPAAVQRPPGRRPPAHGPRSRHWMHDAFATLVPHYLNIKLNYRLPMF